MRKADEERRASAALLRDVGTIAFGPYWQVPLARALGRNPRTVRRWAAGDTIPSESDWTHIRAVVEDRRVRAAEMAARLKRGARRRG